LGLSAFGHTRVKIVDGGRDKWVKEAASDQGKTAAARTQYPVPSRRHDAEIRAFADDTLAHMHAAPMIDVRSPGEFSGAVTHMPEYPQEGVLRGGHIRRAERPVENRGER